MIVSQGTPGPVTVSISPKDIILSHERFDSSALNSFQGVIRKAEEVNGSLHIYIDTGITFCALITHRSFHGMELNIGKKIWVTFKANAVKVF
jgi:tungstate transport system ATP-binding protein